MTLATLWPGPLAHSAKSSLILTAVWARFSTSIKREVSSANILIWQCFIMCVISFRYINNISGPRTDH